jgi:hypothetical protein
MIGDSDSDSDSGIQEDSRDSGFKGFRIQGIRDSRIRDPGSGIRD